MAALTAAKLRNAAAYVDKGILSAMQEIAPQWSKIAILKSPGVGKGLYGVANDVPVIDRKQGSGYRFSSRASNVIEVNSQRFGTGLTMSADDVADDLFGIYDDTIAALGRRIARFPDEQVFDLLKRGDETAPAGRPPALAVDGLPLFSASHKINVNDSGKGTQSNLLTSTALSAANFTTAYARLMEMQDTEGKRLGLVPNRLIVPPVLWKTAADILEAPTISTGGYNVQANQALVAAGRGRIEIVVEPELTGDDAIWYLAAVSQSGAPILYQVTEDIRVVPKIDPTDNNVFYDDSLEWLAKGRVETAVADYRRIIRCEA